MSSIKVTKQALVVMQHIPTARRVQHALQCGGLTTTVVREVGQLDEALAGKSEQMPVVCLPQGLVEEVLALRGGKLLRRAPAVPRLFISAEEPDPELYRLMAEMPQIGGVLGLRYPGAPPRPWELLSIARRVSSGTPPPAPAPLAWGHTWRERSPATPADRDAIAGEVSDFCSQLMGRRLAENVAVLAHELLMNAMYDAPVDDQGKPLYANSRDKNIELPAAQRPEFGYGSDGRRMVLSVSDPFGRLPRETVFRSLHRGLTAGTMDVSGGGAGLGLVQIHQGAMVIFFDVVPGAKTQVTTVLELDVPARELRQLPRSLHFFIY